MLKREPICVSPPAGSEGGSGGKALSGMLALGFDQRRSQTVLSGMRVLV